MLRWHRWPHGPWWTWPWPHWFFARRRLRLAWDHLPPERRAQYSAALRQIASAGGLTYTQASQAISQLAQSAHDAWNHPDVQRLVREREARTSARW